MVPTCQNEGVDGDPVVLVLLVGIGALQPEAGQRSPEEVKDQTENDEGSTSAEIV